MVALTFTPLLWCSFHNVTDGTPPIVQSFHTARATRRTCATFMDNLYSAFLEAGGETVGLTGDDFGRLLRALCTDFPPHLIVGVLSAVKVGKQCACARVGACAAHLRVPFLPSPQGSCTSDVTDFDSFSRGIHACLLYAGTPTRFRAVFVCAVPPNRALTVLHMWRDRLL